MRDKTRRFVHDDDIVAGPPRWPSSCETPSPLDSLPVALPNGRASCCPGNTLVCEGSFDNPPTELRKCGKSSLVLPCDVPAEAGLCPPDKYIGLSRADREMRSVGNGSSGWHHEAYLHVAWPPENRPLVRPSSRCSLAWCIRCRPPPVEVSSAAAVPRGPQLVITVSCRWPPVSPPLRQSVRVPHPWKSARYS